jgi:hypothetical protein
MRTRVLGLLALPLLLATLAAKREESPPVILVLAGQSNMVGQGRRAELPAEKRALPANVALVVGNAPEGKAPGDNFGPELALAHELAAKWPGRKFVLLKFAVGTTSIRAWAPDWSEADAAVADNVSFGALYPRLLGFLRPHLASGAPPPHAILWFQGERDARFAAAAADYAPRLDAFIERLRRDLAAPDSWFILGVVNPPYPDAPVVAGMQRDTPRRVARAKAISAEGLTKRADKLHYDTAGQWELGLRFARELLPTLGE